MRWLAALVAVILFWAGQPCTAEDKGASSSADAKTSADGQASNAKPADSQGFKGIKLEPTLAPEPPPPPPPVYNGKPVRLSGGVEDKELEIQWDDWRNKFGSNVERRIFHSPIEALVVPMGITSYFHCTVTNDKHVKDVRITKSSGVLWYDRAVKDAVESMQGDDVLLFPEGSQRSEVSVNIGFTHVDKKTVRYVYYNDIEHSTIQDKP
jgi:hypothetical protein